MKRRTFLTRLILVIYAITVAGEIVFIRESFECRNSFFDFSGSRFNCDSRGWRSTGRSPIPQSSDLILTGEDTTFSNDFSFSGDPFNVLRVELKMRTSGPYLPTDNCFLFLRNQKDDEVEVPLGIKGQGSVEREVIFNSSLSSLDLSTRLDVEFRTSFHDDDVVSCILQNLIIQLDVNPTTPTPTSAPTESPTGFSNTSAPAASPSLVPIVSPTSGPTLSPTITLAEANGEFDSTAAGVAAGITVSAAGLIFAAAYWRRRQKQDEEALLNKEEENESKDAALWLPSVKQSTKLATANNLNMKSKITTEISPTEKELVTGLLEPSADYKRKQKKPSQEGRAVAFNEYLGKPGKNGRRMQSPVSPTEEYLQEAKSKTTYSIFRPSSTYMNQFRTKERPKVAAKNPMAESQIEEDQTNKNGFRSKEAGNEEAMDDVKMMVTNPLAIKRFNRELEQNKEPRSVKSGNEEKKTSALPNDRAESGGKQ